MFDEWITVQKIVIGYVFSSGKVSAFQKARTFLCKEYFTGKYAEIWDLLVRYYDKRQEILSTVVLRNLARAQKWTEQLILEYEQVIADCEEAAQTIAESDIGYYADRLAALYREVAFNEVLTKGMELLYSVGYVRARDHVISKLSNLEKTGITYTSEMSLQDGVDEFIYNLSQTRVQQKERIYFGINGLDNSVLGLWRGDFVLIAGFAGVGKTSLCVNTGVEVAFVQKRNLLYVTTETVIDSLKRRIFARISKLPLFDMPVSSREMKEGALSEEQKNTLLQIQKYLKEGDMGKFVVIQAPPDASLAWLRGKLLQYESRFKVELVILDDLRNLRPETKRGQEWEEFNDLLKGCKAIARTHAGRGVPIISPYQTNRMGYKAAREAGGRYDLTALSSSSEAERTPDLVLTLWGDPDDDREIVLRIIKQRDGESGREVRLRAEWDFQNYYEVADGSMNLDF